MVAEARVGMILCSFASTSHHLLLWTLVDKMKLEFFKRVFGGEREMERDSEGGRVRG